jgi:hypothetical protein
MAYKTVHLKRPRTTSRKRRGERMEEERPTDLKNGGGELLEGGVPAAGGARTGPLTTVRAARPALLLQVVHYYQHSKFKRVP